MLALAFCILALGVTFWAGKRSLGQGLIALLTFGYFYGIVRANLQTMFGHFIFDAALIGLYLSQEWSSSNPVETQRLSVLRAWTIILIAWPALLILMPFQPLLVSLVGFRGSVFFLLVLLLGGRLSEKDLRQLSVGFAVLNLIAAGFAVAEYFLGIQPFFPRSPLTHIIYASEIDGGFHRIPAIFANAHSYGGTMVASLPYLLGGWEHALTRKARLLAMAGMLAGLFGVLASDTRLNFVTAIAMIVVTISTGRMSIGRRVAFALIIVVAAIVAMTNERFGRFKSLSESGIVSERVQGSVNRAFFEILLEHPLGNGLGGGGTSLPYFLDGQVRNPIATENEYIRILCEQGVIGLLLWISFVVWYLFRAGTAFAPGAWTTSRRATWGLGAFVLCTAWIGNGLLTSIPGTMITLLGVGWTALPMRANLGQRRVRVRNTMFLQPRPSPARTF
jgi:O-Antigen ligase